MIITAAIPAAATLFLALASQVGEHRIRRAQPIPRIFLGGVIPLLCLIFVKKGRDLMKKRKIQVAVVLLSAAVTLLSSSFGRQVDIEERVLCHAMGVDAMRTGNTMCHCRSLRLKVWVLTLLM